MTRRRGFKGRSNRASSSAGAAPQTLQRPAQDVKAKNEANHTIIPHDEPKPGAAEPEPKPVTTARERLAVQKQTVGERHPDYATGLNQLALLLIMHGKPDEAEPLLSEALEIRRELLGEKHPDFATNLSSLAGLLWAKGDLERAEPLMRQALEVRWEVLGSHHPKTVAILNSLEQLLRAKQAWQGPDHLLVGPASTETAAALPVAESADAEPDAIDSQSESETQRFIEPELALQLDSTSQAESGTALEADLSVAPAGEPEPGSAAVPQPVGPLDGPATGVDGAAAPDPDAGGTSRADLLVRHERLAAEFARIGDELSQATEGWKSGGIPPAPSLIVALEACRHDFGRLRDDLVRLAGALGATDDPTRLTSLHEIADFLHELAELEGRHAQLEAVRTQALAVLDRVLGLSSADGTPLAPLLECQAKARSLRASVVGAPVLDLPEAATQLAEGDHPFHALLTLVAGGELDDDVWATLLEAVEREFGKPLSVAVARSRVCQA